MLKKTTDVKANPNEEAHCKKLLGQIKYFDKQLIERVKSWDKAVEYANGRQNGDDDDGLVRTNIIGSKLEAIQPTIYAKAPEISVEIDDHVDTSNYPFISGFAKTLEAALNVFLVKDAKLKTRGKTAVRYALTNTVGYAKVIYQRDRKEDPSIRNRINDTQDNIELINRLIEETQAEGGQADDHEAKLEELKLLVESLEKQVEIVTAEGLVVDVINPKDLIVLDASYNDVDDFAQAPAIAHRIKITVGEYKNRFQKDPPSGCKTYLGDKDKESKGEVAQDDHILYLFEVWSLQDLTIYTLCDGYNGYVREPLQPVTLGAQWYPFFALQFRRIANVKYPYSMVEQLMELGDEYNRRRTAAAEHKRKNRAIRLLNKSSSISDQEINAINDRGDSTQVIGVTSDPNQPLANQITSLPEIPYNPQMYDTSDILFDIETVSNAQDAASGAIRTAKTATEAEIASSGQQSRTSEMLDVLEDWLSDISTYSAQLLLQNVNAEMIKQRFGEASVWPELDKKDLFGMVNIKIRAGSTSKPNRMRERDQWIQLLPELKEGVQMLMQAKQTGNVMLEKLTVNLLEETFKRFDEKLDIKTLLGLDEDPMQQMKETQVMPQIPQQVDRGLI